MIFLYLQPLSRYLILEFHYHKLIKDKYTISLSCTVTVMIILCSMLTHIHINSISYFHLYETRETCRISNLKYRNIES